MVSTAGHRNVALNGKSGVMRLCKQEKYMMANLKQIQKMAIEAIKYQKLEDLKTIQAVMFTTVIELKETIPNDQEFGGVVRELVNQYKLDKLKYEDN